LGGTIVVADTVGGVMQFCVTVDEHAIVCGENVTAPAMPGAMDTSDIDATAIPDAINKRLANIMVALLPVGGKSPAYPSHTMLTVRYGWLCDPSCPVIWPVRNAS
jgi:hypothetical protein